MNKRIELGYDFALTSEDFVNQPSFEYTEHSSDHWHPDRETDVYISRDKAIEIINFLKEFYKL